MSASNLAADAHPAKKRRLSLQLKKPSRFFFTTVEDVEKAQKVVVPTNTKKATQWSQRIFRTWQAQRNEAFPDEQCPEDILLVDDADTLSYWLSFFCKEARKANGEAYTPHTISQILAGLLRYMREEKQNPQNIMDTKVFASLHRLLDSLFKELHADGVGAAKKQADVIGFAEEQQLWESGILSTETPIGLFKAVFCCNRLNLILRGGDEHRALKISQFQILTVQDPDGSFSLTDCLVYTEHRSKN